jgi:transketolase
MSNFAPQPADEISIATIRTLAADVVAKANSGHPGAFSALSLQLLLGASFG